MSDSHRPAVTTNVDEGRSPQSDPRTGRYPCPWCRRTQAWPDGCVESIEDPSGCTLMIEQQCLRGDHRRCAPGACTVAARWHAPVRAAGIAAVRAAGRTWALVSTIHNEVQVVRTLDHLGRAKLVLRTVLLNAGLADDAEGRGLVDIVRGSDGGLF